MSSQPTGIRPDPLSIKRKLKARVNRSDARTIRHALEELAANCSARKDGDEFVFEKLPVKTLGNSVERRHIRCQQV